MKADSASWSNAVALSKAEGEAKEHYIKMMDRTVVFLANRIINSGLAARFILLPVVKMESKNVGDIIDVLLK